MAYRFVHAHPKQERMNDLRARLEEGPFESLQPFGKTLSASLIGARVEPDGTAVWEEEDYCVPPLAQERAAVLDHYFDEIHTEDVPQGEGWAQIRDLPRLFEGLKVDLEMARE